MDTPDFYDDIERFQIKRHESVQGCHVRGALILERQLVEEYREEGKEVQLKITLPSLRRILECASSGCDLCRIFADNIPEPSSKLCFISRVVQLERRISFVRHVDSSGNKIVLRRTGRVVGKFRLPEYLEKYNIMRES